MLEEKPSSGKKLIVLGFAVMAFIFVIYSRYQNPEVFTPDAAEAIQRIAYGFYIVLFVAFWAIAYGLHMYL